MGTQKQDSGWVVGWEVNVKQWVCGVEHRSSGLSHYVQSWWADSG